MKADPLAKLNRTIAEMELDEQSRTPAKVKLDSALALSQSKIVQVTALVAAIGAVVTSLVVALKPDNSTKLEAYDRMEAMYEAVRKDAIRQNHDNATTRTEVGRIADEKSVELELMRDELDTLRKKTRLPVEAAPPPMPPSPKLPPVAPVTLPKKLDDVPPLPEKPSP